MQVKTWLALGAAVAIFSFECEVCEGSDNHTDLSEFSQNKPEHKVSTEEWGMLKDLASETLKNLENKNQILIKKFEFAPETLNFFTETLRLLEKLCCLEETEKDEGGQELTFCLETINDEIACFNGQLDRKGITISKTEADKESLRKEIEFSFRLYEKWKDYLLLSSENEEEEVEKRKIQQKTPFNPPKTKADNDDVDMLPSWSHHFLSEGESMDRLFTPSNSGSE